MRDRAIRACDITLQVGLLLTIMIVPAYFNIADLHIFEPDKAILLRDLAAVLASVALLRLAVQVSTAKWPAVHARSTARPDTPLRRSGQAVLRRPTVTPWLLVAATTLLATVTSLLPSVSWGGSYARSQGALTVLAYLVVALIVCGLVRQAVQAHRLGATIALSGVLPAAYGWVQHFGFDPLPWQQPDLTLRVPGTMGNPIFLGALLVMTLPLALYRLAVTLAPASHNIAPPATGQAAHRPTPPLSRLAGHLPLRGVATLGWALVVVVEAGGLLFTKSRGPFAGLLVALIVFGLVLARAWALRWLRTASLAGAIVTGAVLLGSNVLGPSLLSHAPSNSILRLLQWTPRSSGSSEVRLLIWRPALDLIARHPLLGCGPDVLQFCYYPVYPTALRHVEAPNAVPDRTHNILLDAAVETGLLGLVAVLALLATTAHTLMRLSFRATDPARRALAAALLAALAGHVAEGFFGITVVATGLLTWLIAGVASALTALEARESEAPVRALIGAIPTIPVRAPRWPILTAVLRPVWRSPAVTALTLNPAADVPERGPASHAASTTRHTGAKKRQPSRAHRRAMAQATPWPRWWTWSIRGLAYGGWLGCVLLAWQVIASGVTATAADVAARQASDLEFVAQANSGQTPLPPRHHLQPILALRQFSAAAANYGTAIRLVPSQEEYLLDAGRELVEWAQDAGDVGGPATQQTPTLYAQALLDFGRAARLNPYDPDPLRDTGKAYERWAGLGHDPAAPLTWNQDLLSRAGQAFAQAARLAPHHPDPLTSWAQVVLWQGQPQHALTLANRALALDAQDGDGYRLRGEAEDELSQPQSALRDWRRALADPNLSQRGPTAAHLALAEATWAHAPCVAVHDAHLAMQSLSSAETLQMREILHVDGPRCPSSWLHPIGSK